MYQSTCRMNLQPLLIRGNLGGIALGTMGDACTCEEVLPRASCPHLARKLEHLEPLSWSVIELASSDGPYEAIVVGPQAQDKASPARRVLVMPHGGPHASFSTQFYAKVAFYSLQLNAICLLVNYCGSTGWPETQLRRLPGRCGELDIQQVHNVCTTMLAQKVISSAAKCAVVGGSHGGFIGTCYIQSCA